LRRAALWQQCARPVAPGPSYLVTPGGNVTARVDVEAARSRSGGPVKPGALRLDSSAVTCAQAWSSIFVPPFRTAHSLRAEWHDATHRQPPLVLAKRSGWRRSSNSMSVSILFFFWKALLLIRITQNGRRPAPGGAHRNWTYWCQSSSRVQTQARGRRLLLRRPFTEGPGLLVLPPRPGQVISSFRRSA
jgi:hypothetical protein